MQKEESTSITNSVMSSLITKIILWKRISGTALSKNIAEALLFCKQYKLQAFRNAKLAEKFNDISILNFSNLNQNHLRKPVLIYSRHFIFS